ncbi:hypothetical protein CCP2SC5_620008 [Azospirillaceae bacterium]
MGGIFFKSFSGNKTIMNQKGPGTVFLVAGDHKGGAKAPLTREAIFS